MRHQRSIARDESLDYNGQSSERSEATWPRLFIREVKDHTSKVSRQRGQRAYVQGQTSVQKGPVRWQIQKVWLLSSEIMRHRSDFKR